MKEKILGWLKQPIVILSAIIAGLGLYIKILLGQKKELETEIDQAKTLKTDAALAQKQSDLSEENQKALAALEAEKGRSLTQDEMTDFLNNL